MVPRKQDRPPDDRRPYDLDQFNWRFRALSGWPTSPMRLNGFNLPETDSKVRVDKN